MNIKLKKGGILEKTENIEGVSTMVVTSEEGTPLFVILQHGDAVYLKDAKEDSFTDILQELDFI